MKKKCKKNSPESPAFLPRPPRTRPLCRAQAANFLLPPHSPHSSPPPAGLFIERRDLTTQKLITTPRGEAPGARRSGVHKAARSAAVGFFHGSSPSPRPPLTGGDAPSLSSAEGLLFALSRRHGQRRGHYCAVTAKVCKNVFQLVFIFF